MEQTSKKTIVSLKDIFIKFDGEVILNHINLDINEKEFVTILGPSGCGKTTTLRIIGGFVEPDSGDVIFGGKRINGTPPNKRNVNTVFQKYSLFPHLNVFDNVAFGLKLKKMPKDEIKKRVTDMLATVDLKGYEKRSVAKLSGGQQQRVAIARALVCDPEIILLDEPLGALDLKLRKSMQLELKEIQQKTQKTFIYVTHDQEEALTMSDRVVVMNNGVIEQIGSPEDIYNEPVNAFVADFIGEANILNGIMLDDCRIQILGKELECVDKGFGRNTPVDVVIRPEDIDDEPEFMAKHTDCQLDAQVDVSEMMGAEIYLYLEYKGNKMTARVAPTSKARNGDKVRVAFDPHKVHVFDVETEQTILN